MIPLNKLIGIIDDKKGLDITALDVAQVCSFTDTFLIASTRNYIQIDAIASAIQDEFKLNGLPEPRIQGQSRSGWVVLDCKDIIIHLFSEQARASYSLEKLWANATPIQINLPG